MTGEKCRLFQSIAKGVIAKYQGQVSKAFTDSVIAFIGPDGKCTNPAVFNFTEGMKDRDAMSEIRVLLVARQTETGTAKRR